jgi:ubiquinone/menaquinone biosynthesis C-methylase UbiE
LSELVNEYPNIEVSGIDISDKDVESAEKILPLGNFLVTDNKKIPHENQSFDVVISSMTLHHMTDPVSSLEEMKRVVKNTGKIYLVDITYRKSFLGYILNKVKCPEPYHFEKFYSEAEVNTVMDELNLLINNIDRINIFPATSIIMPVTIFELKLK